MWSLQYLMGQWHPTIGDPSFIGWFTVGSYFACAIVASVVTLINQKVNRRSFFFWSVISLLVILLAINKQLDLQTLFAEVGRQVAKAQGWMDQRRTVQFLFIAAFVTVVLVAFLSFAIIMRDLFRRFILAFAGLFFLLSFVIIRAASFHHFDEVLGFRFFEEKMWVLELAGIFSITLAGLKEIIHFRKINTK